MTRAQLELVPSQINHQNINKLIVEESLSIKSNTGENRNKQLFRINMFHTTSRIDVNGKDHQEFIETDLPNIIKLDEHVQNECFK